MKQKQKSIQIWTTGRRHLLAVLLTLCLLVSECGIVKAADVRNQTAVPEQAAQVQATDQTDTYIITLEENKQGDALLHQLNNIATEEYQDYSELPEENIAVIQADESKIKELKKTEGVRRVEEDIILNGSKKSTSQTTSKEADSSLLKKKQKKIAEWKNKTSTENTDASWNIQMIGADDISDEEFSGKKIKVAVIDSGMDMTEHYDVKEHINFVKDDEDVALCYEDRTGHGTAIAGIIAGNSSGIPGINPDVELYSLKVLNENNQSPVSRIIEAIHWCIDHDIQIINMSFGTSLDSPALRDAVTQAANAGILMIAATGNTGGRVEYPAAYKQVMAVGSIDSQGEVSDYSCEGSSVEILAPGEKIVTEGAFSSVTVACGTSMSVPHVAGAASIIWQKNPAVSAAFVRELLKVSAKNVEGRTEGILDVEYALEQYDAFKESYREDDGGERDDRAGDGKAGTNRTEQNGIEENNSKVETFNTDNLVEGSWMKEEHQKSVTEGLANTDLLVDVSVIREFVPMADKQGKYAENGYNFKDTKGLHGGGNYVANLQYLFNVAKRVEEGKSVTTAIAKTKYKGKLDAKENSKITGREIKKGLDAAIIAISNNGKNKREKSQRILALAFHLAGDIYAHESMVPKSSLDSDKVLTCTDIVKESHFSKNHFSTAKFKKLKELVNDGVLKFVNINEGCKENYKSCKYYEDNPKFFPTRFTRGTVTATSYMLIDMYKCDSYFDIWCLVPEIYHDSGYGINRYKIYDFALECCSDTLTADEKRELKKHSGTNSKKFE